MPAPALSGLAAARPPSLLPPHAPQPPRPPAGQGRAGHGRARLPAPGGPGSWGAAGAELGSARRPPRGSPALLCFLVTSSLRTGLCRTARPGSSSHSAPPGRDGSHKARFCPRAPPGARPGPGGMRRGRAGRAPAPLLPAGLGLLPSPKMEGAAVLHLPGLCVCCVCFPGGRGGKGRPGTVRGQRGARPGLLRCKAGGSRARPGPGFLRRGPPKMVAFVLSAWSCWEGTGLEPATQCVERKAKGVLSLLSLWWCFFVFHHLLCDEQVLSINRTFNSCSKKTHKQKTPFGYKYLQIPRE